MSEMLNAVEIFRIAEQIERDGSAFYRNAALKFDRLEISGVLNRLADWELAHERAFAEMRAGLGPSSILPDTEDSRALASLSEFAIGMGHAHDPATITSVRSTIELAVKLERDSITFYTGLKGFVGDTAAVEKIDRIIAEERLHIQMLREQL